MAKLVLKPIQNKILINRKTRCKFSFSTRVLENPDIEFVKPKNGEQGELIKNIREIHYKMDDIKKTLARATKFRDMRWVDELKVEIAELQEKLDNELYPEIDRVFVETAEDLRRKDEGNTNIQVNLDAAQIAKAITDAGAEVDTISPDDVGALEEVIDMDIKD